MDIQIIADTLDELQYSTTIPETQTNLLIPGATTVSASGDYGALLFQHLATGQNSIWYGNYLLSRDAAFKSFSSLPYLELHFTCRNDCNYHIEGIGAVEMHQAQFNVTYLPYLECHTYFHKGTFQTFDIHITQEFLLTAALHYKKINEFLTLIDKHKATNLSKVNHRTTPAMQMIIQQIKSCSLQGAFREFYIDNKITELLILVLDVVMNHPAYKEIKLKSHDIECLQLAHEILVERWENPCSLIELARKAGINDFKLKKGFKQYYGTSVFNYLANIKMEKSMELLRSTEMSVAEVAYTVGYQSPTAFSAAFNKKFGYPPSVIKK